MGGVRRCQHGNLGTNGVWRQGGTHTRPSEPNVRSKRKVLETVLPPPPAVKKGEEKSSGMGRRVGAVRKLFKSQLSGHFARVLLRKYPEAHRETTRAPSQEHKQVRDPQSSTKQPCSKLWQSSEPTFYVCSVGEWSEAASLSISAFSPL